MKAIVKNLYTLKISFMYFRVFIRFCVCTCIHDTRYTIHDIDNFVYTRSHLWLAMPHLWVMTYWTRNLSEIFSSTPAIYAKTNFPQIRTFKKSFIFLSKKYSRYLFCPLQTNINFKLREFYMATTLSLCQFIFICGNIPYLEQLNLSL